MTTSNENHDPRSLLKRSNLPTYTGHKRNSKHKVRKGPVAKPGLKESLLHNVTSEPDSTHDSYIGTQLHAPLVSQSIAERHDKLEETRLPISPPPEEEIRIKELSAHGHTSKDPHSPVRNPRKRTRSVTCTRPGSSPKRRPRAGRSSTPEVPYEPPTEQFTPPRDVVMQIPSSAVSSRSRKPKALTSTGVKLSVDTKIVKIKTERLTSPFPLPSLDLSKPAPPPSPTDDPLLLVGPPKVVRCSATPSAVANKSLVDISLGIEEVVQDGPHASVRDPDQSTGSHIFYSDDEDAKSGEDEGEYTGCFRFYRVPVEKDPPSSATRARRVSWGRPISPFPFSKRSPRLNTNQTTDHFAALHDRSCGALQEFRHNLNSDDGVSDEEGHPTGLVEVSSDDPKAAARAAAILKLHHSYVVDGPVAQRPCRRSHNFCQSFVASKDGHMDSDHDDECMRRVRRKSMAASAGVMQHRSQPIVPSPLVRLTFNETGSQLSPTISEHALQDAEREIRAASASPRRSRTLFRYVSPSTELSGQSINTSSPHDSVEGNTEVSPSQAELNKTWTNGHWRMLDICFTDERLLIGRAMGLDDHLADVDDIAIGSVVERFLAKMEDGDDWDRDKLLRRVTALSARQRAGKGAPPSPNVLVHQNSEVVVPVCTSSAVSRTLSPEAETGATSNLPPSLLAPRYAHLHEEVTTTSVTTTQASTPIPRYSTSNVNTTSKHNLNVLPLPPPDVWQVVRGPINTPAKKPIPRGQHPRDLVRLVETQLPTKPVQFPKGQSAKDLVNLNHIEPPRSVRRPRSVSGPIFIPRRNRKDSGGSVKDLVKSFEAVHRSTAEEVTKSSSRLGVRKTASVGNLRTNRFGSHVV